MIMPVFIVFQLVLLHKAQCSKMANLSCLYLYSLWANFGHSLSICITVSCWFPHNLNALLKSPSFSFFSQPCLIQFHEFWFDDSVSFTNWPCTPSLSSLSHGPGLYQFSPVLRFFVLMYSCRHRL